MSDLKKAFIGGYKKSAVDEIIHTLNEKLEKAEAGERQALRRSEISDLKIAELERRVEQLRLENENLEKEKNNNQRVFGDIAKVYKRAYDAGYDIVRESKDTAVDLLHGIHTRFEETAADTEATLAEYEDIREEVRAALSSLNDSIAGISDRMSAVLDKAKSFSGIYDQMKVAMLSAAEDTENALEAYENYSSEFLAVQEAGKNEHHSPSEDPAALQETAKEPEVPAPQAVEPPAAEKEETEERTVGETGNADDSPRLKEAIAAAQTQEETAKPVQAPSKEEPEAPVLQAVIPPAAEKEETEAKTVGETGNADDRPRLKEVIAAAKTQEAAKPAPAPADHSGEFTQFGRRTRVSADDRNELIRKALLKNTGS